jgi:O-antigen/teichoic acid export membrane protein
MSRLSKQASAAIDRMGGKYSKLVGVDLPYLIKGGFWISLGQAVTIVKAFILSVLFANYLPQAEYGQYTFYLSLLSILLVFSLPGLSYSIINSVSKGKDGTYAIVIRRSFFWSLLGSATLVLGAVLVSFTALSYDAYLLIILAAAFPLYAISTFYNHYFTGRQQFKRSVGLTVVFDIVSASFLAAAIFLSKDSFWLVLTAVLVQIALLGYFTLVTAMNSCRNDLVSEEDVRFGMKTSFSLSYNAIVLFADNIIVGAFLGFEALAAYALITLIPEQVKVLFKIINQMMLPRMIRGGDIAKKAIWSAFGKLSILAVFLWIAYAVAAPFIFSLFYPQYSGYSWLSILLALGFVALPSSILHLNFIKLNRQKEYNNVYIISSTIFIVGSVVGVVLFGMVGAIVNRVLYRWIIALLSIYYTRRMP